MHLVLNWPLYGKAENAPVSKSHHYRKPLSSEVPCRAAIYSRSNVDDLQSRLFCPHPVGVVTYRIQRREMRLEARKAQQTAVIKVLNGEICVDSACSMPLGFGHESISHSTIF